MWWRKDNLHSPQILERQSCESTSLRSKHKWYNDRIPDWHNCGQFRQVVILWEASRSKMLKSSIYYHCARLYQMNGLPVYDWDRDVREPHFKNSWAYLSMSVGGESPSSLCSIQYEYRWFWHRWLYELLKSVWKKVPQSARLSAGGPIAIWAMPKCRGRQGVRVLPYASSITTHICICPS